VRRSLRTAAGLIALVALAAAPLVDGALARESKPSRAPAKNKSTAPAPKKAPASDASPDELQRLKQAAEEQRRKARELKGQEQGVLNKLRRSDEALSATRRYITRLDTQEKLLDIEIERKEESLTRAGVELERRRDRLADWVREAYKRGRTRQLEVFFSSADFGDLLKKTYFLSAVMQQQRHVIADVRDQRLLVENEKVELEQREREVHALRGEKEAEQVKYKGLKEAQGAEVSRIRGQRKSYEQAARELEAAASKMQKLLADLEEKRKRQLKEKRPNDVVLELDKNNFGANRGRLPWPVRGELIGRFGTETHPEWGTQIRNNGLDIRADDGTPVQCVGEGQVELVEWLPGYGQSVIVNHGQGYYSVYAHLGSVSVSAGGKVSAGQVVGTVGDSGSLKGTCLHFEIRKGRDAQNPAGWLR
jgi:septal ring factor EnvC (AmiA/AmiB activator)